VILNRLAVALWVFSLGIASRSLFKSVARVSYLSAPPIGALALSFSGPSDALPLRYPALFAFGDEPSLFSYIAQNTTFGHRLAETLEQTLL
jgi:hypothetical protein